SVHRSGVDPALSHRGRAGDGDGRDYVTRRGRRARVRHSRGRRRRRRDRADRDGPAHHGRWVRRNGGAGGVVPRTGSVRTERQRAGRRSGQTGGRGEGQIARLLRKDSGLVNAQGRWLVAAKGEYPPRAAYRPAACDRRVVSTYSDRKYYRPDELTQAAWRRHIPARRRARAQRK